MSFEVFEPGEWSDYKFLVVDTDRDDEIILGAFDARSHAELFARTLAADQSSGGEGVT